MNEKTLEKNNKTTNFATYKVAAYLRLSQEDGDKEVSDSIVSQKNIIEKKVEELGQEFSIIDYYIDDGYTRFKY